MCIVSSLFREGSRNFVLNPQKISAQKSSFWGMVLAFFAVLNFATPGISFLNALYFFNFKAHSVQSLEIQLFFLASKYNRYTYFFNSLISLISCALPDFIGI